MISLAQNCFNLLKEIIHEKRKKGEPKLRQIGKVRPAFYLALTVFFPWEPLPWNFLGPTRNFRFSSHLATPTVRSTSWVFLGVLSLFVRTFLALSCSFLLPYCSFEIQKRRTSSLLSSLTSSQGFVLHSCERSSCSIDLESFKSISSLSSPSSSVVLIWERIWEP